jgi:hypothetical protein
MTRVIARVGYTSPPDWVPVSRVCRVPRHLDRPRNARRSGRRSRPIWTASSRIVVRGYDHVMVRTSHSALVTRLFTRAPILLTLPSATSSASSSATSSLDPMGATLKRFPHGATTGPRPQRPGRRYGQLPHRPGPDRPVGRLLLTEDLTRWAEATARLFAETDAREDAGHLETVWVLEDA